MIHQNTYLQETHGFKRAGRSSLRVCLKAALWIGFLISVLSSSAYSGGSSARSCKKSFLQPMQVAVDQGSLAQRVHRVISHVKQFQFIKEEAKRRNLRVWLFGGTAAGLIHYCRLDLAREEGLVELQPERFQPYDFTEIYRSTQDLDIVVDGNLEQIRSFQQTLAETHPYFLGDKANQWEVRSLRRRIGEPGQSGFKEALINDFDFQNQSQ